MSSVPAPVEFAPAGSPVDGPVTKMGGRPAWLEVAQWPLSRGSGAPMEFLGQFALRGGGLGYLFMTAGDGDGTFEPEGGENALIIQPGGRIPDFLADVREERSGPTVAQDHLPVIGEADPEAECWQFLGGPGVEPFWLQGEEVPGEGWELLVQLDSTALPFHVNFGDAGIGYAFLSPDGKEGRFLWQCT
ncbi:hypothetical protein [Streptomyces sp. NPDC051561]|uniref:hypothetical protein n=1 Tax=Streptomyces sp. NPDC051561 TaxID=3365658 RepID=UPI0037B148D2